MYLCSPLTYRDSQYFFGKILRKPVVNVVCAQETGSILKIGFALSNWPHLHRAYLVTVCNWSFIAVYDMNQVNRAKIQFSCVFFSDFLWKELIKANQCNLSKPTSIVHLSFGGELFELNVQPTKERCISCYTVLSKITFFKKV